MKVMILLIVVSFLVACSTAPGKSNDKAARVASCDGYTANMSDCYKVAKAMCKGDFDILKTEISSTSAARSLTYSCQN